MFRKKGIVNLLKPPGISSFGAIGRFKKLIDHPKAGHTGTLDPRACGVLPVCFGRATKVIPYIPEGDKEYIAEITLGKVTDTLDAEGDILFESNSWKDLTVANIKDSLKKFIGNIDQIPPMYSAVKQDGKRLYKLARKGKNVERKTRSIKIENIDVLAIDLPRFRIKIKCSRGTYIRSVARDIGKDLGCGAFLSFLIRSKSGPFVLKDAVSYKMIKKQITENKDDFIYPLDWPLEYPGFNLKKSAYKKAINGTKLYFSDFKENEKLIKDNEIILVYSDSEEFISINEVREKKLKPLRVFS